MPPIGTWDEVELRDAATVPAIRAVRNFYRCSGWRALESLQNMPQFSPSQVHHNQTCVCRSSALPDRCSLDILSSRGAVLSNTPDPHRTLEVSTADDISRYVYFGNGLFVDPSPWHELHGTISRTARDDGATQGDGESRLAHPAESHSPRIVPCRCQLFVHRTSARHVSPHASP